MGREDTIVAISTALGQAGIGIVRLSGERAVEIVETFFKPASGKQLQNLHSHTVIYGHVVDPESGEEVDEVLTTVMRKPRTYTREDIVEVNCHSGAIPLKKILSIAIKQGARLAEPGEFTRRAFLNGRIDLAQAEAVVDLIRAQTSDSYKFALKQLKGRLSDEVSRIKDKLVEVLAHLEASIDFPEEDIEPLAQSRLAKEMNEVIENIKKILSGAEKGIIYREGLRTAIVGRPNVGKSSLLNAILKKERAIVTPIPGTTRDIIEEAINIRGIPLVIMDTAGIREPQDKVEEVGVGLTTKSMEEADLILCVIDQSEGLNQTDKNILKRVEGKRVIVVLNKTDLPVKISKEEVKRVSDRMPIVQTCALTGEGVEEIEEKIEEVVFGGEITNTESILITNIRHQAALEECTDLLREAVCLVNEEISEEISAMLVKEALAELGKITGETTTEDLLDKIFSEFCIGK